MGLGDGTSAGAASIRDVLRLQDANGQFGRHGGALDSRIDIQLEAKVAVALIDGIGFDAAFNPTRWPEETQREVVKYYIERLGGHAGPRKP